MKCETCLTDEEIKRIVGRVYWSAYHAGHNDTVEGLYCHVDWEDRHDCFEPEAEALMSTMEQEGYLR